MKNKRQNLIHSLILGLSVLAAIIIYAYGFQVTKVNLAETKSERRQEQLIRILRALAQPDLVEYDKEEFIVTAPIFSPCPVEGFSPPQPEPSSPYLILTPACADARQAILVEGYNFEPFTEGPLHFVPVDSDINLQLGSVRVDKNGNFSLTVRIPNRPSGQQQTILAIMRRNIGSPRLTQTAIDTWDKIIETVFLALLATTLGTLLAIPLSFFAARNLMSDITSSLIIFSLSILFIPVGLYLGSIFANLATALINNLIGSKLLIGLCIIICIGVIVSGIRWALPQQETSKPTRSIRIGRIIVLIFVSFSTLIILYLVAFLAMELGNLLATKLGAFGFLGSFLRDLGDILNMVIQLVTALAVAGLFSSFAGRLGEFLGGFQGFIHRANQILLSTLAGAFLFFLIIAAVNWLYEFPNADTIYIRMTIAGGISGLLLGLINKPSSTMPTGMIIYYISRTILNTLRSIEALVMVIVFVVWVGIGPFAGALALALHTIAALSKLYSEQIESIMSGPIEAVQATGATRLQTIVYAVVPQIIPPYISFTMYRWDINVRMSTIIGFAGGGGIGFLLQQNINLLNYRAASAQMLAIAIVVAAMDYISSKLREKVV